MKRENAELRSRLNLLAAIVLLVGLGSALLIYHEAENVPYGALGYESAGGNLYPVMPEDSKAFQRDMELYGGTFNVLADEFRRWFQGLWHGKSLAGIIACTTIIISGGLFYAARHLTGLKSWFSGENQDEETE